MPYFYIIDSIEDLTPRVRHIRLRPASDTQPVSYRCGQYVRMDIAGYTQKPFSLAGVPGKENDKLDIYVTRADKGVLGYLSNQLLLGEKVRLHGPYGDMPQIKSSRRPVLLVSGGTGIIPLEALARKALECEENKKSAREIHLFHGARSISEVHSLPALQELAQLHPRFNFEFAFSEKEEKPHYFGTIDLKIKESTILNTLEDFTCYVCGPPGMLCAVIEQLLALKASCEEIFYDKENLNPADFHRIEKMMKRFKHSKKN